MVIIDAHCHMSRRSGSASNLIKSMDGAGVDMACIFSDNEFVEETVKLYPNRFIPYVYFDTRYAETELEKIDLYVKEKNWKEIKTCMIGFHLIHPLRTRTLA